MKKILIVEDDHSINDLLSTYLKQNNYETIQAFHGLEALSKFEMNQDVCMILLDIMLPFKSGDAVLKEIRTKSKVPVIMLTAKSMTQTKIDVIRMGADDYITKPFDLDEVLVRIEAVLRRTSDANVMPSGGKILTLHKLTMDTGKMQVMVGEEELKLTGKEFQILELLLENPNKLFSRVNLYETVWEEIFMGDDRTIKAHMSNLRNKLKTADPDHEYIETVWGMGYRIKQ